MKLSGLFDWAHSEPTGAQTRPQSLSSARADVVEPALTADELEEEKRWLQLVRIDADRFQYFFDKYHDHLHRYFVVCTGSDETAQDLTQETFVEALAKLGRFAWQGKPFGAWLFHIARRRVLRRHRRAGRRLAESEFARRHNPEEGMADPGEDLERRELCATVNRLIQGLRGDRRDVFILCVQLEYAQDEAARLLDMAPGTLRSHLARGRVELAQALLEEPGLSEAERQQLRMVAQDTHRLRLVRSGRTHGPESPPGTGGSDDANGE